MGAEDEGAQLGKGGHRGHSTQSPQVSGQETVCRDMTAHSDRSAVAEVGQLLSELLGKANGLGSVLGEA